MTPSTLHIWRSSRAAFAKRTLAVFVLTYLLLTPAWPYIGSLKSLALSACLSVVYMFVLDDFAEWRRHRFATWTLTPGSLIYENPLEDMAAHSLPLAQITRIRLRFFWSLVITLDTGQAVTMAYIHNPKEARAMILRAQAAAVFHE